MELFFGVCIGKSGVDAADSGRVILQLSLLRNAVARESSNSSSSDTDKSEYDGDVEREFSSDVILLSLFLSLSFPFCGSSQVKIFLAKIFCETKMSMDKKANIEPLKTISGEISKLSLRVQHNMTPVMSGTNVR
mgnify:CR=1 FL=1